MRFFESISEALSVKMTEEEIKNGRTWVGAIEKEEDSADEVMRESLLREAIALRPNVKIYGLWCSIFIERGNYCDYILTF